MVGLSIASSVAVAALHARVIHGFLVDRLAAGAPLASGARVAAGATQPLIIVELGARSGRFAYQLIHRLASRCQRSPMAMEIPFVYVLGGHDDEILDRWQAHPRLEPLIARGWLDCAHVDVDVHGIALRHTGIELSAETKADSLVIIANQIFSRAAHDLFYVEDGQLYRCTQSAIADAEAYQLDALANAAVYERDSWNRILAGYAEHSSTTGFSFPTGALAWMERLRLITNHGMLLCADHGYVHEDSLNRLRVPPESGNRPREGGVNFSVLAELVLQTGDAVLAPAQPGAHFTVAAFLHGETAPIETARAYHDAVDEFCGPDEWHTLGPLIERSLAHASAEQLCAYVRLSGWDDRILTRCMPHLLARVQAGEVSGDARLRIRRLVEEVWTHYFPEREPDESGRPGDRVNDTSDDTPDIAFAMGSLLFGLGYYQRALVFFERSLVQCGQSAAVYYNMAMCVAQLGQLERALEYVDTALVQNPNFTAARDMRLRVMGSM